MSTPDEWSWNSLSVGTNGAPISNALGPGTYAWRVTDLATSLPNPNYNATLAGQDLVDATQNGWRFAALARYVSDFGTGANMGLSMFVNNRAYHLMLDLTTTGDLQARLADESAKTYVLTNSAGAGLFHRFELASIPGTSQVEFVFDGRVMNASAPWDGTQITHPNTIHWGNSDAAGSALGAMDFNQVEFRIGPFDEPPGDYNGDGVTDGGDLLQWQQQLGRWTLSTADANENGLVDGGDLSAWKNSFGATAAPTAGATPEPGGMLLAALTTSFLAGRYRRRR